MAAKVRFSSNRDGEYRVYAVNDATILVGYVKRDPAANNSHGGAWVAYDQLGILNGWHRTRRAAGRALAEAFAIARAKS